MSAFLAVFGPEWLNCIGNISIVSQQPSRRTWIIHRALLHDMGALDRPVLTTALGPYWRTLCRTARLCVHLSALVLLRDGLEGVVASVAERTLCINEANLSVNQDGGGTPGRVGAFYMSHQNATKLSSPSGVSHGVTLGQVRVCVHASVLSLLQLFCACCLPSLI